VPRHTISFVIICDDPDAPGSEWSHWVLFNVAASVNELPEGASKKNLLPPGSIVGRNDFKITGYGGPCPPSGLHRYFFKLYALDCKLKLNTGATKQEVLLAIRKHVLGMAFIMGKYRRVR
jgi:Raf kinase inhibitor-like YbhB/YbcL family protein